MDILEKKEKKNYSEEIKKMVQLLKFNNEPIELKGSSSLKSQKYFSDYDFFTFISKNYDVVYVFNAFDNIMFNIEHDPNIYFVEFKIQTKDEEKYKLYSIKEFKNSYDKFINTYSNIDFYKIDLILFSNNRFIEVSCIYQVCESQQCTDDYIKSIKEDIKELIKEKKYYKVLKRLFNIYKTEDNKKMLLVLNKIFNSELGKQYAIIANLEAIEKIKELKINDTLTKRRIQTNLKDLKLKPHTHIKDKIKSISNNINQEAKNIIDKYDL